MYKQGKTLREFNVRNGKYAVQKEDGTYDVPIPLTYAESLAYDPDIATTPIYGDGEQQKNLINDKGYTGTFVTTAHDLELETKLGHKGINSDNNSIDEQISEIKKGALYVEVLADTGSTTVVGKKWMLGVEIGKAGNSFSQNTDNPNPSNCSYPLNIYGDKMLASGSSTEIYVDPATGLNRIVRVVNCIPTDSNYATFGDAVPIQRVKASV